MSLNRRQFQAAAAAAVAGGLAMPNVLRGQALRRHLFMIYLDDMNAMSSALDGFPLIKNGAPWDCMPNQRRLRDMGHWGTMTLCGSPYCMSSRLALLNSLHPHQTGIYGPGMRWTKNSPISPLRPSDGSVHKWLVRWFHENGYATIGTGKGPHDGWNSRAGQKERYELDPKAWTRFENCGFGPCQAPDWKGGRFYEFVEGDPFDQSSDGIRTEWFVREVLEKAGSYGKPVFGMLGISKPHLPYNASAEFYDLFDGVDIPSPAGVMPEDIALGKNLNRETSRDWRDLPSGARCFANQNYDDIRRVIENGTWLAIVKAYLAACALADKCIGMVLDAIPANSYVILVSDHGFHLGEHLGAKKFTLWDVATRSPFVIAGEGITPGRNTNPMGHIDIYPTVSKLLLGDVPTKADLGGLFDLAGVDRSAWLAQDPAIIRNAPEDKTEILSQWSADCGGGANLITNPANAALSLRNRDYRFTSYADGSAELYAHSGPLDDPHEWRNLLSPGTGRDEHYAIAEAMKKRLPDRATFARPAVSGDPDEDE